MDSQVPVAIASAPILRMASLPSDQDGIMQMQPENENTITIVGQGYVGLPLAHAASLAGLKVWGLDVRHDTVEGLKAGRSHVDDLSDEDISEMLSSGYQPTLDAGKIRESSVVIVCVPTPLAEGASPDLSMVKSSMVTIGQNLRRGMLVVLESTTYPGTTEEICKPILEHESGLESGVDFLLAYSPERVNPGDQVYGIANTPKIVGGVTDAATNAAVKLYSRFIDSVVPLSGSREAETAKLLENTFRHVNIALVNEMAKFCHELGIDIWEVIRGASTKPFGFMRFTPGPGVGGHCIPIDPNYLSFAVRRQLGYPFRFVELAQETNNSMPRYVASRIAQMLNEKAKAVKGSRVLLIGVTYKPNIADQRESPAVPVAEELIGLGADVAFHDPYVIDWRLADRTLKVEESLDIALANADVIVILQNHESYDLQQIVDAGVAVLDTRGVAPAPAVRL